MNVYLWQVLEVCFKSYKDKLEDAYYESFLYGYLHAPDIYSGIDSNKGYVFEFRLAYSSAGSASVSTEAMTRDRMITMLPLLRIYAMSRRAKRTAER